MTFIEGTFAKNEIVHLQKLCLGVDKKKPGGGCSGIYIGAEGIILKR